VAPLDIYSSPIPALSLPLALTATAAPGQEAPPPLTQAVNDFADVVDAESARELDRRIRSLKQTTGDVVVVATVPTYQPYADIDEYAVKMFENGGRGIGDRGRDNGLLIVVAVQDRKVRIEVGYDLEGAITDGFAGETIREFIAPQFRSGNYGRGLVAGTTRIINRIAAYRGVTLQDVPPVSTRTEREVKLPFSSMIFILLILLALMSRGGRGRRRRYWGAGPWSGWDSGVGPFTGGLGGGFGGFGGGGSSRGGFGGFGGGRSGGGGASGGW
jgi:uncharacterized protein